MATVVGANGSGKSTLFDALSFLKDALTIRTWRTRSRDVVGFENSSAVASPVPSASSFTFVGSSESSRKRTASTSSRRTTSRSCNASSLAVYERKPRRRSFVNSFHRRVAGKVGKVIAKDASSLRRSSRSNSKIRSALAIKGLGQFKQYQAIAELSELLENWHVSDLHVQEAPHELGRRLRGTSVGSRRQLGPGGVVPVRASSR